MPINSSHLFSIMLRHITANDVVSDDGKLHTITAVETFLTVKFGQGLTLCNHL
jgi:hypothetical protein